ncbi:MAG: hypothetical protein K0S21_2195 [Rhizobiaceae bacterium]|nr:hypothetical protein [Rhizobiaceae bacterium]
MVHATMHDPVADADQAFCRGLAVYPVHDLAEAGLQVRSAVEPAVRQQLSAGRLDSQTGLVAEIEQAPGRQTEAPIPFDVIKCELDAGRAGIDSQHGARHQSPAPAAVVPIQIQRRISGMSSPCSRT